MKFKAFKEDTPDPTEVYLKLGNDGDNVALYIVDKGGKATKKSVLLTVGASGLLLGVTDEESPFPTDSNGKIIITNP